MPLTRSGGMLDGAHRVGSASVRACARTRTSRACSPWRVARMRQCGRFCGSVERSSTRSSLSIRGTVFTTSSHSWATTPGEFEPYVQWEPITEDGNGFIYFAGRSTLHAVRRKRLTCDPNPTQSRPPPVRCGLGPKKAGVLVALWAARSRRRSVRRTIPGTRIAAI